METAAIYCRCFFVLNRKRSSVFRVLRAGLISIKTAMIFLFQFDWAQKKPL